MMKKKAWYVMAVAGFVCMAMSASAQNFTTNVSVDVAGNGSARYTVENDEGSVGIIANDGRLQIDVPNGTARVFFQGSLMGVGIVPTQKLHLFQSGTASSRLRLQNSEGYADFGTNDGIMQMYINDVVAATLNQSGDMDLEGVMSSSIVEIRGGSDLSEKFDVNGDIPVLPGMVVSIDPAQSGKLTVAREAYDRKVAGVVSGAGGLNTGMIMSQQDMDVAHGEHPVALTGRVYCFVDADIAPVQPGDLLTTSATPGHAMKAVDHAQAMGATIGKAMTSLESGKGLVLVLVNLH